MLQNTEKQEIKVDKISIKITLSMYENTEEILFVYFVFSVCHIANEKYQRGYLKSVWNRNMFVKY